MDRITFDFENGTITFDTDGQKGVEIDPKLKEKRAAIMAAAGYDTLTAEEFKDMLREGIKEAGYEGIITI